MDELPEDGSKSRRPVLRAGATIVVYIAAVAACCALLTLIFERPNFRTLARDELGADTEIVTLGTSRVFRGVDPLVFRRKATNLASGWLDYVAMRDIVNAVLPRVPSLRGVAIEMDFAPHMFSTYDQLGELADLRSVRDFGVEASASAGWAGIIHDPDRVLRRWLEPVFLWRLTPAGWSRMRRNDEARRLDLLTERAGFLADEEAAGRQPEIDLDAAIFSKLSLDPVEANRAALLSVVRMLLDRDIPVVLLRMPAQDDFRRRRPRECDAVVLDTILRVRDEFPGHPVFFWDFDRWPSLAPSDFSDGYHLDAEGARKLTRELDARWTLLLETVPRARQN